MSPRRDHQYLAKATARAGIEMLTPEHDQCQAIMTYLASKSGTDAYTAIVLSPLCGRRDGGKKHQRRTRKRRAKEIRAELKPELQAVGLLPLGPIFWLLLTSPTLWSFLYQWISTILTDLEEGDD
jgi:hypothetical protein